MLALALSVLLAAPANCPPDQGQIRWDDFSYSFNSGGKRLSVTGPLWDRDRNGKPSRGDLFRIDDATSGRDALGIDQTWVVLGGGLASQFNRRFRRIGKGLNTACESRFEIKGVPTAGSPSGLGRIVLKAGGGGRGPSKIEQLEGDMRGWAEELCSREQHLSEAALAKTLAARGTRAHRGFKRGTMRRTANAVANDFGLKCAHLSVPKLTFD